MFLGGFFTDRRAHWGTAGPVPVQDLFLALVVAVRSDKEELVLLQAAVLDHLLEEDDERPALILSPSTTTWRGSPPAGPLRRLRPTRHPASGTKPVRLLGCDGGGAGRRRDREPPPKPGTRRHHRGGPASHGEGRLAARRPPRRRHGPGSPFHPGVPRHTWCQPWSPSATVVDG